MKVVVAHNRYSSAQPSGENIMVDVEIAQLREAGVDVVPFVRSSDEIATLPTAAKALLPLSPIYAPSATRHLRELIRQHQPDLLHLHNPYPLLSPWIVRTAQSCGIPVVQTVHNYRHVCVSGIYYRDGHVCTDCAGRMLALPAIAHGCYRGSRAQSTIMAATLATHRSTWRRVDRYIALTDAIAEHLRGFGIPDERIVVKPNSVADPGQPEPSGNGFLVLGRLSAEKGIAALLAAWTRMPDGALGPLRIVGDGPLRHLVEQAAADRSDVLYLGTVGPAGVRAALAASAALVVASTWHDVLPTVILEALSCGRPVLGTRMGGIPSLIGEAGWVVEPTTPALSAGLAQAHHEAASLVDTARRRYLTTFHPDVVVRRQLALYRDLTTGRQTR